MITLKTPIPSPGLPGPDLPNGAYIDSDGDVWLVSEHAAIVFWGGSGEPGGWTSYEDTGYMLWPVYPVNLTIEVTP